MIDQMKTLALFLTTNPPQQKLNYLIDLQTVKTHELSIPRNKNRASYTLHYILKIEHVKNTFFEYKKKLMTQTDSDGQTGVITIDYSPILNKTNISNI